MNIFHKVTVKSLKENRTRTVVTVIGVILSAAMICAVTTFASSLQNFMLRGAVYDGGNWHGRTEGADTATCEKVFESDEVDKAVYMQQLGYAAAKGCQNEFKPYIYLLGASDGAEDVFPVHITSGRYPANPGEILLPEHLYSSGRVKYDIGDRLDLSLGKRMLDGLQLTQNRGCYLFEDGEAVWNGETLFIEENRTYTVVGFYERPSWNIEPYSAPGYTALTIADPSFTDDYCYDIYFRMKNPRRIYGFMSENGLGDLTNSDLLMAMGTFRFSTYSRMLSSLAAIVIVLITFGSVALIYNAFSISVSERTKQFGLLSSAGATKRQLRHMVLYEALVIGAIGIPIGICAGVGGIGVTLMLTKNKFRSLGFPVDMKLSVSFLSVAAAAVTAFVTVIISAWIPSGRAAKISPIKAVRQNRDITVKNKELKTPKLTFKLFGLPGVLADKYYKRRRKKYRATVLSLFMSVVLFVSASAFTDYLARAVEGGMNTSGYDLVFSASPGELGDISPQELCDRVLSAKAVTGVSYELDSGRNHRIAQIDEDYLTDEGIFYLENGRISGEGERLFAHMDISFVDDGTFRSFIEAEGLDEEEFMDPGDPPCPGA